MHLSGLLTGDCSLVYLMGLDVCDFNQTFSLAVVCAY